MRKNGKTRAPTARNECIKGKGKIDEMNQTWKKKVEVVSSGTSEPRSPNPMEKMITLPQTD